MKRILSKSSIVIAVIMCVAPFAASQTMKTMSVSDLYSVRRLSSVQISPDGSQVFYTVRTPDMARNVNHEELWTAATDASSPPRSIRDITKNGGNGFTWAPDSKALYYVTSSGDEIKRLSLNDLSEETLTKKSNWKLTDGDEFQVGSIRLFGPSPDGKSIAFGIVRTVKRTQSQPSGEKPNGLQIGKFGVETDIERRFFQLAILNVASRDVKTITDNELNVKALDWSPDSSQVVVAAASKHSKEGSVYSEGSSYYVYGSDIYVADIISGKVRSLVQQPNAKWYPRWSPDGKWIAFLAVKSYTHCPCSISILPPQGGVVRELPVEQREGGIIWDSDSKSVLQFDTFRQTETVYRHSIEGGSAARILPHNFENLYTGFTRSDNGMIAFLRQSVTEPPDVYVASSWDLSNKRRITDLNPELRGLARPQFEQIKWRSSDNKFDIYSILVKPVGHQPGKRYPLIVLSQGGPGMASARFGLMDDFPVEPLATRGYLILYPNTRGRDGEGAEFQRALTEEMKYTSSGIQDALDGIDMLVKQGIADPGRLAVMGHSYGGTFTLNATNATNRFKAAIDHEGTFIDIVRLRRQTRTWEWIRNNAVRHGISIETPEWLEAMKRESPLTHVDKVRTPTLMEYGGYGKTDPMDNARGIGAIEYFQSLQFNKVPSELVIYPKEGHGWIELKSKVESGNRYIEWLDYWVRGIPTERMLSRYGPPNNADDTATATRERP